MQLAECKLNKVNARKLNREIFDSGLILEYSGLHVDGNSIFVCGKSVSDRNALIELIAAHIPVTLEEAMTSRMLAIDEKTKVLMTSGFTYRDEVFSNSAAMQRNLRDLSSRQLAPLLPLTMSTKDNMGHIVIATVEEFEEFNDAAFNQRKAAHESGNSLKSQVRAVTSDDLGTALSLVADIVDSR